MSRGARNGAADADAAALALELAETLATGTTTSLLGLALVFPDGLAVGVGFVGSLSWGEPIV
jgi:hypothetical protein